MERPQAHARALEALEQTGYAHIAGYRSVACSDMERFVAQAVRACMMQYAKIVIIRPFVMLKDTEEICAILSCLETIGEGREFAILDMLANRLKYEAGGSRCRISV